MRKGWPGGRGWTLAVVVAVACLGAAVVARPFVPPAVAGDPKIAESLFKSGKQALGKGEFESAVSFFKKALEETPELIEACWWRGSAQEKAGRKPEALASYREYLTLFEGKNSSGAAISKEETRLKGLAEKGVESLAAGEKEFKKLEDAYVAQLLAFAKENFLRDPGVCSKAVDAILAVQPENADALGLGEKLGGSPGATATEGPAPPSGPFKAVKTWIDLIENTEFKGAGTSFDGTVMTVDTKDGFATSPAGFVDTGTSFAYEAEFRLTATTNPRWVVGIGAAFKDNDFIAALAVPGQIVLTHAFANGKHQDLVSTNVPVIAPNTWHRLGIIVKGPSLETWFDGRKTFSWREPNGSDLKGEICMTQLGCRVEWRLLRAGKLD